MLDRLGDIEKRALSETAAAGSLQALEQVRVAFLGRKGELTALQRSLGQLPADERPAAGRRVNELRAHFEQALASRRAQLEAAAQEARLREQALDVTLPGRLQRIGTRHPLTQVLDEMKAIFVGMGFEVVEGPEVEWYRYNFEALNYPEEHPAMDEQDSFYVTDDILLRTQTSPVQVRVMEQRQPPLRVIAPGRTYRREAVSVRLSHTFHQLEGYEVGEGITFADLKGTLQMFVRDYFGPDTALRFRPDFFPFTEPSADVSITCGLCRGSGCAVCKHTGWLEIAGCGLIHENVLRTCGYDAEQVSGWAFGFGLDRIAMRRFGIDDIRLFWDNDMRFLRQF